MSRKFGEDHYDPGKFLVRGLHELGNAVVFPDSNIPVRDYSGMNGPKETPTVEPTQPDHEMSQPEPELEHDEPDLDL